MLTECLYDGGNSDVVRQVAVAALNNLNIVTCLHNGVDIRVVVAELYSSIGQRKT